MAVSTLLPRCKPHKVARNYAPVVRHPPQAPLPARLAEVEDRLLAAAVEHHPNRQRAIAHLLSDVERPAALQPRRELPTANPSSTQRIEDLLLQAVLRTHPNRAHGINRLLGDVVGDAALDDDTASLLHGEIEQELALSDTRTDTDFDGMS